MTTQRFTPLPKAKKGKCRWCGADTPKGRKTWCSQDCVNQYLMRSSAQHVRSMLKTRDQGTCAICGIDADFEYRLWQHNRKEALRLADWLAQRSRYNLNWSGSDWVWRDTSWPDTKDVIKFRIQIMIKYSHGNWTPGRRSGWDADHIIPVSEGGGQCDLANYRTLCHPCHKRTTKELAARLAQKRKAKAMTESRVYKLAELFDAAEIKPTTHPLSAPIKAKTEKSGNKIGASILTNPLDTI